MEFRDKNVASQKRSDGKVFVARIYGSRTNYKICERFLLFDQLHRCPLELFIWRVLFHRDLYWKARE